MSKGKLNSILIRKHSEESAAIEFAAGSFLRTNKRAPCRSLIRASRSKKTVSNSKRYILLSNFIPLSVYSLREIFKYHKIQEITQKHNEAKLSNLIIITHKCILFKPNVHDNSELNVIDLCVIKHPPLYSMLVP